MRAVLVTAALCCLFACGSGAPAVAAAVGEVGGSFTIENDRFLRDGKEIQIISGSIHYFRIHPAYWRDRLERARAMGLNAIEMYVAWNMHEPYPGQYAWTGFADVERFVALAHELGLLVLLRPGPYICAEWDFGGFPWWFGSSKVAGGRTMAMRSSDPAYLAHVDRWWAVLFSKLARHLYVNGGPIVMVQIENEYGFCGNDKDYLRHLVATARTHLGPEVLLYTTDPPAVIERGTLAGDEVYSVVDFGPAWFNPGDAYRTQASFNPPGRSPPFCSEFYTGWLSHWAEPMANTSTEVLVEATKALLEYGGATGSLSFYMVHGGSNFGFWAGANVDGQHYMPHITSYDYDAPISEAGDYCQPGIGGLCKFEALRALIAAHTGAAPPPVPPPPALTAHGPVALKDSAPLFAALPALWSGEGVWDEAPRPMEEYGQRWGLTLYRTWVNASALEGPTPAVLDLGAPIHDYAGVFLDGRLVARLDRSDMARGGERAGAGGGGTRLALPAARGGADKVDGREKLAQLDILVEAMGHQNFGCDVGGWDLKGLQSSTVLLNDEVLRGWRVFPLQLDDLTSLSYATGHAGAGMVAAARRLLAAAPAAAGGGLAPAAAGVETGGPMFYRGALTVAAGAARGPGGHLADTFLDARGWGKGIAWVNGFNLGWYWASRGPQMTLYVPGPVLREGENEILILEVEASPRVEQVSLVDRPDFYGPEGPASAARNAAGTVPPSRRRRVP